MLPILISLGTEIQQGTTALGASETFNNNDNTNPAWSQALAEGLRKLFVTIGNAFVSFGNWLTSDTTSENYKRLNEGVSELRNVIADYPEIIITPKAYEFANIFYAKDISNMLSIFSKSNQMVNIIKQEVEAIAGVNFGDGLNNAPQWQSYATHLYNIGFLSGDKITTINIPGGGGNVTNIDFSKVNVLNIPNFIQNLKDTISLIRQIASSIENLNNDAIQKISTIVSTDLPTKPSNPFDIPLPTIPRSRQQEPETIHPDIVRDFGIADEIYAWWVEHMNRLAELTKTQTAAITRTITITATEEEPSKGRGGNNWWRKTQDKRKSIERIKADVSLRSEWIKWVIFTFPKKEDFNSNAKGKLTFVLKNGNSYDIGTYSRGTFSYIAVLMMGTGYGWWSAIPKNKRRLSDPETISYNMPNISTQIRIKSIAKELTTDGIYYW